MKRAVLFGILIAVIAFGIYLIMNGSEENRKSGHHHYVRSDNQRHQAPLDIRKQQQNLHDPGSTTENLFHFRNDVGYENAGHGSDSLETLAFVTPWNNKGYRIAKQYAATAKFTYISPVWFQIRPVKSEDQRRDGNKYVIAGTHDIDAGWTADVGKHKVYPRVTVDYSQFSREQLNEFFNPSTNQKHLTRLGSEIIGLVAQNTFGGIVLEYGFVQTQMVLHNFLVPLLQQLQSADISVILVIAPYRSQQQLVSREELIILEPLVHRFMVMTYDYATSQRTVGPNAPVDKMILPTLAYFLLGSVSEDHNLPTPGQQSFDPLASKILLGLNFYGYKFKKDGSVDAILGDELQALLDSKTTVKQLYDSKAGEHVFKFPDLSLTIYYPTLKSISERLKLAKEWRLAGVGIWEMGQGMDSFYNLF